MIGTSIIGKVVPTPQGNWDGNKRYTKLDIVYYNNKSYIARKDVPAGASLPSGSAILTEYWQLLATGTAGSIGPTGQQGPTGPTGDVYYPIFNVDFDSGNLQVIYYDKEDTANHPTFAINDAGNLTIDLWRA